MKKARIKDLEKTYGIILECSDWLKSKGIKQWNPPYPKNLFEKDIKDGNVYYFSKNGKLCGTCTLSKNPPFYYPAGLRNLQKHEIYISRLAVSRGLKGRGIGKKLLHEIESYCKSNGIRKIKLDAIKSNKFLHEYYSSVGFNKIKEFKPLKIRNRKFDPAVLMEKRLG